MEHEYTTQYGLTTRISKSPKYATLLEQMQANCVEGKETITFAKEDWANVLEIAKQVEQQIENMSKLTPVNGPHGLCKATVCQWEALGRMRNKALKDAEKVDNLYLAVDYMIQIIDNLVAEKLITLEDWWTVKAGQVRSKVDDMKRDI